MRNPVNLRAILAGAIILAIVAPIIAQAWPVCADEGMTGEMRCAGLWAAGCCDYYTARERVQGSGDEGAASIQPALPVGPGQYQYLAQSRCPERVAGARASTSHPEHALSSAVLRL